jgi:signal transduction histidine kinase/CheY-like chemotaxis protein
MSNTSPTAFSRASLTQSYRIASFAAGLVGVLATLGAVYGVQVLQQRGLAGFNAVTIFGAVFAGFFASILLFRMFVKRRMISPLVGMLREIDFHLNHKDWQHTAALWQDDALGVVASRCEDMIHEITAQQKELENASERFQVMIARLSEAKEAAEQADHAKTQFMARMSHEVRTPINGVLGMVELLLDSGLTESQTRLARIIKDSGKTLLGIIDGLLDFAKLEVDKLILETTPFDLQRLVEDVVGLVAPTAHAKNLDIACCIDPRIPSQVIGDPFRLRQVLTNLIGNAIKFTAEGEVAVDVILDQGTIRFEVSDTGVGIPPDALERIFEPFAQASVQVSRQYGGTGLGLSIAQQLVQLMGGQLTVESTLNVGSTFSFMIVLPAAPESTALTTVGAHLDRRILLIETSEASARALSSQLLALGVKTAWVTNITDGFERLRQGQTTGKAFDGVIAADQAGGLEFLRRIQESPLFSHLRTVISAPLNRIQTLERMPEMAQTPILAKPFRRDDLSAALHKVKSGNPLASRSAVITHRAPVQLPASTEEATILVAEDNLVNAEVARRMLSAAGYSVSVVENGRQAVEAARTTVYGLILMDGQMPEMDGVDAAKAIRAYYQKLPQPCPPPPIIAVTADAFDNARARYLAEGMDDFIAKPFSRDDLLTLVARWIRTDIKTSVTHSGDNDKKGYTPRSEPAVPEPALPVLDQATLDGIAAVGGEGDTSFLAHIIAIYCRDMPISLRDMENAIHNQNTDAVRKLAHKMKSSSANLGAKQLAHLAARIEKAELPATPDVFRILNESYQQVAAALRACLPRGDAL